MQVAAHEPAVAQPLNMYFDERPLWVTQYSIPVPRRLEIEYDKYLRAGTTAPPPPPIIFAGKTRLPFTRTPTATGSLTNTKPFSTA